MLDFSFYNPVRLEFGRKKVEMIDELIPQDAKVMILYGGGSVFRNGAYAQVKKAVNLRHCCDFGGIEANPRYETCLKAVEMVKQEKVDFLLAVGGGSVLDATKFIAAASCFDKPDKWQILEEYAVRGNDIVREALPIGCVMTLPATGSEMNCGAVISRNQPVMKLHFNSPLVYPKFSIINPEFTLTLDRRQTGNGIVDTFVHTAEQYLTQDANTPLQDRMAEGVMLTLIEQSKLVFANPDDYECRANLCWCATVGLNGWLSCGVIQDWATHMIGHELTAVYGIDHARTLAIVMPALWEVLEKQKHDKLLQYARRVWRIQSENEHAAIGEAIWKTREFFNSIDVPTSLTAYGIDPVEAAGKIRERFEDRNAVYGENDNVNGLMAEKILSVK